MVQSDVFRGYFDDWNVNITPSNNVIVVYATVGNEALFRRGPKLSPECNEGDNGTRLGKVALPTVAYYVLCNSFLFLRIKINIYL